MLPQLYMITGDDDYDKERFINKLIYHFENGQKLIQLRLNKLRPHDYLEIAKQATTEGKKYGARIVLNSSKEIAQLINADGIHLSSSRLMKTKARPFPENKLVSAACHNRIELAHAAKIGVDFATLSPVFKTKTHPDDQPLGWRQFAAISNAVDIPVYALGGLYEEHLQDALNNGACGIAAINSLWHKKYL